MKKYHFVYYTPDELFYSKGINIEAESMEVALKMFIHQFGFEPIFVIMK